MAVAETTSRRPTGLTRPVDHARDRVIGSESAEFTLVEYGSYACGHCHAAHEVVKSLRTRFGDRLRYVYRHLPLADRRLATSAAELVEYASATDDDFWKIHDALMHRSPHFTEADLVAVGEKLGVPPPAERDPERHTVARDRVREDARSALESGARVTPTFFINGDRYEGAWDEGALAEVLVGSVGHRLQSATLNFARWAPSTGFLLLLATLVALVLSNSGWGDAFSALWQSPVGVRVAERSFSLSLLDWVNHGLLSIFFLVVGLEIKRELTVGRLASLRAATLPVAAAFGGMVVPALIYVAIVPSGPLASGWGLTIATDTAFAVALIVLLGDRVPVDLRVFLTAAVIVDDLVAIAIVAVFYTESISFAYLGAAVAVVVVLALMNRWSIYRALPYVVLGLLLWFCLHEAGIHATLSGVLLALIIPTRPPPNMTTLMSQAQLVLTTETRDSGDSAARRSLSAQALAALDAIFERTDSPANRVLRAAAPWSSYFVLPVFALANADLVWLPGLLEGHTRFVLGIVLGLVVGKPLGIFVAAWVAVRLKLAAKPEAYSWRQLAGAGAFGGIGFTMSLFIAGQAFPNEGDFRAAKVAIFGASLLAAVVGVTVLRTVRRAR